MRQFATSIGWYLSLVPVHITDPSLYMGFRSYDNDFVFRKEDIPRLESIFDRLYKMKKKGYLLFEFYKLSKKVLGVDLSDYARKNAKKEVQEFLFKNLSEIENSKLSEIEVITTRDALPHLMIDDLLSTLKFIEENCTNLKLFYLEIVTAEDDDSKKALKDWDPTHKLLLSKNEWIDIFNGYNLPFEIYYKNLFSS